MPRPREYPDDLREQLLDAAAHLLATEGPAGLSTRRVAAQVGTSTTAIYRLWGSKPELVRALFLEGFRRLAAHLDTVERTDDPVTDLRSLGLAYHANAVENPELYGVMFACPVPGFEPDSADASFALSTLDTLITAVARCVDAGLLPGPAEDVARRLWAVNHGVSSLEIQGLFGPPDEALEHLRAVLDATIAGLRVQLSTASPPDR